MKKFIKWFTAKQLMERWDIDKEGLAQAVFNGLPVHCGNVVRNRDIGSMVAECIGNPEAVEKYRALIETGEWLPYNINDITSVCEHFTEGQTDSARFYIQDVEAFEEKYDLQVSDDALSSKEKREYGQLKKEKAKWEASIEATVAAMVFCSEHCRPVIYRQIEDHLKKEKISIPDTMLRTIWRKLPEKFKKTAGRPKKK